MKTTAVRTLLLLGLVFLAACSSATPTAAPTQDLNALRTEVAATVLAQVPELCALTPTATLSPTATQTVTPTLTITATTVTPVGTVPPLTTGTANDHAKFISQSVADGTTFTPGQVFNLTWTLMNTGTSTWTAAYRLRFFSGERMGAPSEIALGKDVAPGQSIDIGIELKAPATPGEYRSDWVMANAALSNFNEPVFLKIKVVKPGTSTPTLRAPTSTLAPTATDTPQP